MYSYRIFIIEAANRRDFIRTLASGATLLSKVLNTAVPSGFKFFRVGCDPAVPFIRADLGSDFTHENVSDFIFDDSWEYTKHSVIKIAPGAFLDPQFGEGAGYTLYVDKSSPIAALFCQDKNGDLLNLPSSVNDLFIKQIMTGAFNSARWLDSMLDSVPGRKEIDAVMYTEHMLPFDEKGLPSLKFYEGSLNRLSPHDVGQLRTMPGYHPFKYLTTEELNNLIHHCTKQPGIMRAHAKRMYDDLTLLESEYVTITKQALPPIAKEYISSDYKSTISACKDMERLLKVNHQLIQKEIERRRVNSKAPASPVKFSPHHYTTVKYSPTSSSDDVESQNIRGIGESTHK